MLRVQSTTAPGKTLSIDSKGLFGFSRIFTSSGSTTKNIFSFTLDNMKLHILYHINENPQASQITFLKPRLPDYHPFARYSFQYLHHSHDLNLFSTKRNFARGAEFCFVLLTFVLHESAQTMKNSAPRAKSRLVENSRHTEASAVESEMGRNFRLLRPGNEDDWARPRSTQERPLGETSISNQSSRSIH